MAESRGKILIIDDSKDFLEIFSTKLKSVGYDVTVADGGAKGIELAKEIKPDRLLLDAQMPEMSGIETLAKLKSDSDCTELKIVFLTNYGEPQKEASWIDEKFAREAGAMDYIKKSEDLDTVVKEVNRILSTQTH